MSAFSPESWQEMGPYLDQALDMSDGDRAAWLTSLREQNPALVARLESLLEDHRSLAQERFLERGPSILSTGSAMAGSVVGVYTLLAPIGAGGMGSVWLAERSDGEIQQRVAVKLLGAGGLRSGWRERFLKERQLLASLNHASIVHVIDAGRTDDGQPYLVMEYIEGSPIDVHAAQIPLRDRLTLFLRACDGVSHAHRRLIIHRDLKPSNILVDATGQPKLLDFGIARLLDDTGDPTQTIERMLTPSYASPEQFRGGAQTTATDIYSLGAVLYKLLTGRSPHESQTQSSHQAAVAGEREIPAATRLNPGLPTDVDYILRKALRSEPEERYASVEALASDVRALLEWRPVEARSGDAWYRTRRFLRRYWVPVTAAALVVASLSVGLYIANHERAIAQKRFQDVRQLSNRLFDIDVQVRSLPGSSTARQLIVETSLEYLGRLAADARTDPDLALDVGNAYMRVARAQGVPISPNLGQMDRAEENLQRAEGLVQPVLDSQPANRLALLRSAQIAHDRMLLARFNGRRDEAQALAHRSASALEKFGAGRGDALVAREVLATYLNVASQYVRDEEFDDALKLCDRAIEIGRSLDVQSYTGNFLWVKADMFQRLGDLDEAMSAVDESIRVLNPGSDGSGKGPETLSFVHALTFKGKLFGQDDIVSMGRFDEAAATLTRSFTLIDDLVHQDPKDQLTRDRLADAGVNLGDVLRHLDAGRSLDIYDHTLRHLAEVTDNSAFRRFEVDALAGSSYSLRQLGRSPEARQRIDAAFERLRQLQLYPVEKIAPGSEAEDALRALAEYEAGNGDTQSGIDRYEEILNLTRAADSRAETSLSDALERSNLFRAKAALHRRVRQMDAASALEARCRDLWQAWARRLPNNAFVQRQIQALDSQ